MNKKQYLKPKVGEPISQIFKFHGANRATQRFHANQFFVSAVHKILKNGLSVAASSGVFESNGEWEVLVVPEKRHTFFYDLVNGFMRFFGKKKYNPENN